MDSLKAGVALKFASLLLLGLTAAEVRAQSSTLNTVTLETALVPGPVEVAVLTPPGYNDGRQEAYPMVLLLHGGGGSSEFLATMRANVEKAWERGELPPVVVVTPSAGRSLYMDFRDGSERWETFVMRELIPHIRRTYHVRNDAGGTVISGISMGGMGSLRMAFKYPSEFAAVAALEPAIEAALAFDEIEPIDRTYRSQAVYEQFFGSPVDGQYWQMNHPIFIAQETATVLAQSGLQIYIEVGDEDRLNLFRGGEMLHRLLYDAGVKHEYRLVRGADHVGESIPSRVVDALRFIGRVLEGGF